ncbi:MAG: DUF2807 domain-containing protein [Bacteroidetes bacterium]|nr:DUF2807 domain-containing protein [Bacteroidota bacterium]
MILKKIFITLFSILFFNGCLSHHFVIDGDGNYISSTKKIENFTSLHVSGGLSIHISGTQKENEMTIFCDENLSKYIRTYVDGSELIIDPEFNIYPSKQIKIILPFTQLQNLNFSGAVKFTHDSSIVFDSKNISLDVSGANTLSLPLNNNFADIDLSGASKVTFTGFVKSLHIDASGANTIEASELIANNIFIDASGASTFRLNVLDELNLNLSGAHKIYYKGNPSKINQDISGASIIIKSE